MVTAHMGLQEVVAALHSVILQHEYQFQMAALRTSDTDLPNLSTSITPTGWINIHRVESPGPHDPASGKINGYNASANSPSSKNISVSNRTSGLGGLTTSYSSSSGESVLDSLPRKGNSTQTFVPPPGRVPHSSGSSMSALPSSIPRSTYSNIWKVIITSSLHHTLLYHNYIINCYYFVMCYCIIMYRCCIIMCHYCIIMCHYCIIIGYSQSGRGSMARSCQDGCICHN